jgi:hypothetical protein
MVERKYLPTLGELIDRLSIVTLKYVKIPEHQEEYGQEIDDLLHDINLLLPKGPNVGITAEFLYDTIICAQFNAHIWQNESQARQGNKDGNALILTHSINGIRNTAKNRLNKVIGGRKDLKVDCLAADAEHWRPHGY